MTTCGGDTYTIKALIEALQHQADRSPLGVDTPVFVSAADRQYDIDTPLFENDEIGPAVYLEAGSEVDLG